MNVSLDTMGIGSVASLAETVVNKIWPPSADPNEKLKAQLEIQRVIEARENAVVEAQKSIIVSEMNQADNYTKRARPTVVYSGLGFIFLNHVFLPIWAFFTSNPIPTVSLPDQFWWAWSGVVGVWMIGRTMEKRGSTSDLVTKITGSK